jgi:hypothetical protein
MDKRRPGGYRRGGEHVDHSVPLGLYPRRTVTSTSFSFDWFLGARGRRSSRCVCVAVDKVFYQNQYRGGKWLLGGSVTGLGAICILLLVYFHTSRRGGVVMRSPGHPYCITFHESGWMDLLLRRASPPRRTGENRTPSVRN